MWSLAISCTLIHLYFFFTGPVVVCDAFSDSFCKLASLICYWDMAIYEQVRSWYFDSSSVTALELWCFCGLMGIILDASFSECCILILSKLGYKIVLVVNVFITSQFLHHGHCLPVFGLSSSTVV